MWQQTVLQVLKSAWGGIAKWFVSSGAKAALKQILISELSAIAATAVAEVARTGLRDNEARQEAVRKIREQLEKSGQTAADSAINLAVELAVNGLKSI